MKMAPKAMVLYILKLKKQLIEPLKKFVNEINYYFIFRHLFGLINTVCSVRLLC